MSLILVSKIIGGISTGILITALVASSRDRRVLGLSRREMSFRSWIKRRALRWYH